MAEARQMKNAPVYLTENESTILYLRHHPVLAAKMLLNIDLNWLQRLALRAMWYVPNVMLIWGRRNGKTYIGSITCVLLAMLYPNMKILIVTPAKRQVDFIFNDEFTPLYQNSSYFRNSVVGKVVVVNAYDRIKFTNGSTIVGFPVGNDGSNIRGYGANFLWIDEYAQMSESVINLVFRPMLAVKRKGRFNRFLITSSAFFRWNHMWYLFQYYVIKATIDPKNYYVSNFNYTHLLRSTDLPVEFDMNAISEAKEQMTEAEFKMEWDACVKPGTLISTKNGMKEIQDIEVGEEVLTHTGNYKKVVSVFKREINEDIVKIVTASFNELYITKNHLVYIYNNKEFKWAEAKDIKATDFLLYHKNEYENLKDFFYEDLNYYYIRIRELSFIDYKGSVYNIAVEEDNTYVANYITVHNCFPSDIEGFFSSQLVESCTPRPPDAKPVEIEMQGDGKSDYYMGIDVGRMEGGSNFSISIVKKLSRTAQLVNIITSNGATYQEMIQLVRDRFVRFNICKINLDAGGGGMTIKDLLREKWEDPINHVSMRPIVVPEDEIDGISVLRMVNFTDEVHNKLHTNLKSEMEHKRLLFPIDLRRAEDKELERIGQEIIAFKTELQVMTAKPKGKYLRFEVPNKFRTDRVISTALAIEGYLEDIKNNAFADNELAVGRWIS